MHYSEYECIVLDPFSSSSSSFSWQIKKVFIATDSKFIFIDQLLYARY